MLTLILGAGDIASATAHALFRAGHRVVLVEEPLPTTTRRGMAFTDAVFDGSALLEGITARRIQLAELDVALTQTADLPLIVVDWHEVVTVVQPDILIDARMRKRVTPEVQRGLAQLTIGLGPNFVAGETTDIVIETSWDDLGRIITSGPARPLEGEPRDLGGHARDRYVYAPNAGVFRTARRIGQLVRRGETIAWLDGMPLSAPLDGILRGLTHDNIPVTRATKVIEVDPRPSATVTGIAERPRRIAEGVLQAVLLIFPSP